MLINKGKVEVAALHEVSEDFLNHSEPNRLALNPEVLREVKIGEIETWRQEHVLV